MSNAYVIIDGVYSNEFITIEEYYRIQFENFLEQINKRISPPENIFQILIHNKDFANYCYNEFKKLESIEKVEIFEGLFRKKIAYNIKIELK